MTGSPPHARGRPSFARCSPSFGRITPACAGKTISWFRGTEALPDHPRMRGEDVEVAGQEPYGGGSPPHARGRLFGPERRRGQQGITPACAGKTHPFLSFHVHTWDHPRMRGEDKHSVAFARTLSGSPPHARGRLERARPAIGGRRITPACAGKTFCLSAEGSPSGDHPRMRGEDLTDALHWGLTDGSPPHARGRPAIRTGALRRPGITPACAGKTVGSLTRSRLTTDHPRMRGEDALIGVLLFDGLGSPPHARGRRNCLRVVVGAPGITPACAGKT